MTITDGMPGFHPDVFHTKNGVPYLREAGCQLIGKYETKLSGLDKFFDGFDAELGFQQYLDDPPVKDDAAQLIKFAGQCCYASFGEKRSTNAEAQKYLNHVKQSGHGSVLEHAQYSFFVWGVSRTFSHELVRHRAGVAYSQLSQRFVDGKVLRFIERPEYVDDPELHADFEDSVEMAARRYARRAQRLYDKQLAKDPALYSDDMKKTDLRKRVNQAARACLPNETETWLVFSGNVRAMRHIVEMRAAGPAEIEIRRLTHRLFTCLRAVSPELFSDYQEKVLPDGTVCVDTEWRKV